jgi:hypothetical protein
MKDLEREHILSTLREFAGFAQEDR